MATTTEKPEIQETGRRVATFPRRGSHDKPDSELRISLDQFEGHEYISVRLWEKARHGAYLPTRKGCSIRLSEVEGVADALRQASRMAGTGASRQGGQRPSQAPWRALHQKGRADKPMPLLEPPATIRGIDYPEFSEFDDG